jgi:hypothetical protein
VLPRSFNSRNKEGSKKLMDQPVTYQVTPFKPDDLKRESEQWINLHRTGKVAGFKPSVVVDVREHASLLNYKRGRPACLWQDLLLE